jgi:hypothetical protein
VGLPLIGLPVHSVFVGEVSSDVPHVISFFCFAIINYEANFSFCFIRDYSIGLLYYLQCLLLRFCDISCLFCDISIRCSFVVVK